MNTPRFLLMPLLCVLALMSSPALAQVPEACPQTVLYWADQCGGNRTQICLDGMQSLSRCVITETDVIQWRRSDGSFETTASLAAMSSADLFAALCEQLQDRKEPQDRAEAEYIALLLNVCVGALTLDMPISKTMDGTVGKLINTFEEALNNRSNLDTWQKIVEQVNKGKIEVTPCLDPDQIFTHVSPCG